jgi:hypothetical protein
MHHLTIAPSHSDAHSLPRARHHAALSPQASCPAAQPQPQPTWEELLGRR